jgi:hypothetical protein
MAGMASELERENIRLRLCLAELLRQRNDYANTLNVLDGRQRRRIDSIEEWFAIVEAWQQEYDSRYGDKVLDQQKSA